MFYFQQEGDITCWLYAQWTIKTQKKNKLHMNFRTIQKKSTLAICLQLKYPSVKRLEFNASRTLKSIVLNKIFKLYLGAPYFQVWVIWPVKCLSLKIILHGTNFTNVFPKALVRCGSLKIKMSHCNSNFLYNVHLESKSMKKSRKCQSFSFSA